MNMQNNLNVNEAQFAAITHGDGAMLVLAGPGSGKTLVITQRIRYLIEEHQVKPEDILVITFTKAAAVEMQERFLKISNQKGGPVNFGTFHATFFNILKYTYKFTAGNIIRERDKCKLIAGILAEAPPEMMCQDANEGYAQDTDNDLIQRLLAEISKVKNNGICPQKFASETLPQTAFEYLYDAYKMEMNRRRLIDFDDMVLLCRDLLLARPEVLKLWQERFRYILIDEFQDISPLQYEVVRMIAAPRDNLFIVGDDDQAIYGFRGSKPEIMLNFQKDYPSARQVLLNVNYRSRRDIVETAGRLIAHNKTRFPKAVETQNPMTDGVKIYSFTSKHQQAKNTALLIKQYMEQEDAHYSDIAILYRTGNHMVNTAQCLMQEGIPFRMKEKPKNIYKSPIAMDLTAYLRYALYEDTVSDFFRIMNSPVRYIRRNYVPLKPFSMQELMSACQNEDYVVQNIIQMYDDLHFIKGLNPYAAVNFIRKGVGYDAHIQKQCLERGVDSREKLAELDALQQLAKDFETIEGWLSHIACYDAVMEKAAADRQKDTVDAVNIVTMHASKGLEWKLVILPDVNEGVVPHKKAVTDAELEEERRMFYVAMTRAKELLFLFYIQEKEAGNFLPSRFLNEL